MQWAFFALDLSLPLAATGEFVSRDRGPRRQQTDVKSSSAIIGINGVRCRGDIVISCLFTLWNAPPGGSFET